MLNNREEYILNLKKYSTHINNKFLDLQNTNEIKLEKTRH